MQDRHGQSQIDDASASAGIRMHEKDATLQVQRRSTTSLTKDGPPFEGRLVMVCGIELPNSNRGQRGRCTMTRGSTGTTVGPVALISWRRRTLGSLSNDMQAGDEGGAKSSASTDGGML